LHDEFQVLQSAFAKLAEGFANLPPYSESVDWNRASAALDELAGRLHENYPYDHPFYIGQMLKPPHPLARLAYALAMRLNPNNHALDGGRATSIMEKDCVAGIAQMFGWPSALGHLTSGGTFANFEALWIARELNPGKAVAASAQAHYTHQRLSAVLQIPFESVPVDERGWMDAEKLESLLKSGRVGTVVATLGTTAFGAVDPLPEIADVCEHYGARLHVDAAYGGYFVLADNLASDARSAFDVIARADSIVVDPHKHGLQPYGCGCVLFRDPGVGRFYRHDSPYTYFTSDELHLGEISLECSRPGASAAALWATMRTLPLVRGGEFAKGLEAGREAAVELYGRLSADARFEPILEPELDIVVWSVNARRVSESSTLAEQVFQRAAERQLHLAKVRVSRELANAVRLEWDSSDLTCLRACVMKPSHREWMAEIWKRLESAASDTLST